MALKGPGVYGDTPLIQSPLWVIYQVSVADISAEILTEMGPDRHC